MTKKGPKKVDCAGGLACRGETLLLVEHHGRYAIPKGHPHRKEKPRQTAVREVHEETGYWAEVLFKLGKIVQSCVEENDEVTLKHVRVYMMSVALDPGYTPDRKALWVPHAEAVVNMKVPEEADFLRQHEATLLAHAVTKPIA